MIADNKKNMTQYLHDIEAHYESYEAILDMSQDYFSDALVEILQLRFNLSFEVEKKVFDNVFDVFLHDFDRPFHFSINKLPFIVQAFLVDNYFTFDATTQYKLLSRSDLAFHLKEPIKKYIQEIVKLPRDYYGYELDNYSFYSNNSIYQKRCERISLYEQHALNFTMSLIHDSLLHDYDSSYLYQLISQKLNEREKQVVGESIADNFMIPDFDVNKLTQLRQYFDFTPFTASFATYKYTFLDDLKSGSISKDEYFDYLLLGLDKKEAREDIYWSCGSVAEFLEEDKKIFLKILRIFFYHDSQKEDWQIVKLFLDKVKQNQETLVQSFDCEATNEKNAQLCFDEFIVKLECYYMEQTINNSEVKPSLKIKI